MDLGKQAASRIARWLVVAVAVSGWAGLATADSTDKAHLTAVSVIDYYLGSEERYLSPRSYQGLLEVSHFHLFAMGMLLLVLTHLMLFVPLRNGTKAWLIIVPFLAAILDEGAGWLVRFVSPNFAYAKIAGFLLLETSLAVLVAVSLWSVFAGTQRNYDGQPSESLGEDPES